MQDQQAVLICIQDQEEYMTYIQGFLQHIQEKQLVWLAYPHHSNLSRNYIREKLNQQGRTPSRYISLTPQRVAMKCCKLSVSSAYH